MLQWSRSNAYLMIFQEYFYLFIKAYVAGAHIIEFFDKKVLFGIREARWPNGRASDSGARGRGFILTRVAVLYP